MDEECLRSIQESTTLAEHFQNIVDDCKVMKKNNPMLEIILTLLVNINIFVFSCKAILEMKCKKMHFKA